MHNKVNKAHVDFPLVHRNAPLHSNSQVFLPKRSHIWASSSPFSIWRRENEKRRRIGLQFPPLETRREIKFNKLLFSKEVGFFGLERNLTEKTVFTD